METFPDLITIIVPMYNSAKTLSAVINSILQQSYKNIELLLIDDGSQDDTLKLAKQYAETDKRIKVFAIDHGGASAARNYGLKHMSGKYFSFVDSDDVISKEYISTLYHDLRRHQVDISICNCHIEKYKSGKIKRIPTACSLKKSKKGNIFEDFIKLDVLAYFSVCKLYKTELIRKYNIHFDNSLEIAEDQFFNRQYYKYITTYYFNDKPHYIYKNRKTSLSNDIKPSHVHSEIKNLIALCDFYQKNNIYWEEKAKIKCRDILMKKYFPPKNFNFQAKRFKQLNKILNLQTDIGAKTMYKLYSTMWYRYLKSKTKYTLRKFFKK